MNVILMRVISRSRNTKAGNRAKQLYDIFVFIVAFSTADFFITTILHIIVIDRMYLQTIPSIKTILVRGYPNIQLT